MSKIHFLLIYAIVVGTGIFGLVSCGTKAENQNNEPTNRSSSASTSPSSTEKLLAKSKVRFVTESSQVPGLFSRGSYIDDQHAWVADGAEVRRTKDGGRTWQLLRPSIEDEAGNK